MAFSKVFVILAAAVAMVYAAPQDSSTDSTTVAAAKGNCNADQVVSCCSNDMDASSCFDMSGLLSLPIGDACPGQAQAACCTKTDQTGLINLAVQCDPIPINVLRK